MKTDYENQLAFYNREYDLVTLTALTATRASYIGQRSPRTCRFCGGQPPATKFKTDAHVFPTFIGNRHVLSYHECDDCNHFFGETAEDSLGKLLGLGGVAGKVQSRTGTRKFVSADEKLRWVVQDGNSHIDAGAHVTVDDANSRMTISVPMQPYVPRLAYKALLKMAMTVMPEADVALFPEALAWLRQGTAETAVQKAHNLFACHTTVTGPSAKRLKWITYALLRRKSATALLPYYSFVVGWQQFVVQIFMPFASQDVHLAGQKFRLEGFPMPNMVPQEGQKLSYALLDLTSSETAKGVVQSVSFVGKMERNPKLPSS